MPKFLEDKLRREYPGNERAIYGTLNNMGAMKGNRETPKGRAMDAKHATGHPHANLGKFLHPKKTR